MNIKQVEIELETIKEVVFKNKETVDRLESNWDKDREDSGKMRSEFGQMKAEFEVMRELILKLPRDTRDRLAEVSQPIIDESQQLRQAMKYKKMIALESQETKKQVKPFWQFWRR